MGFKRIAIVNRGEAAMRFIHAAREFNREYDAGLTTIALYTDPERHAMFVREADESVSLGAASFVDPRDGQRKNAYLNYERLERALIESRAEAVWTGWGFVAEHAAFADLCERQLGLVFIGPDGDCMRRLGDKIRSKEMAENAGVPVAPWSGGPVASLEQARAHAERIGYPLMVKATAGGGGRGIRAVHDASGLEENYRRAMSEALKSFGDGTVFLEKLVGGARHIEVQVVADGQGSVWSVGVRDCSVQRRNQKLIEESSSPVLTDEQEAFVMDAAARLCREAGYRNAGTVEFLYDPATHSFAFMEVNARLQVEHPVTEASTGVDLVKLQLHVARGGRLQGEPPPARGVAIEVRLNAEDPDRDFAPAPGRVALLRLPTGAGVRVDTGVEQGDRIPAEFDSMIAKIIVHGQDRSEAFARLRRALAELAVVVKGGTTNRSFLLDLLSLAPVVDGTADVGWLDREPPSSWDRRRPHTELALLLAAIDVYRKEAKLERQVFMASAARGRPKMSGTIGRSMELRHGGNLYRPEVWRCGNHDYRVNIDGQSVRLDVERAGKFERRVGIQGRTHRALCVADGIDYRVEVDGVPHSISRDDSGAVRSVAPAVVVAIEVAEGARVRRGEVLFILEAMKLETAVTAPYDGIVKELLVSDNEQVDAGAPLLLLQAAADARAAASVDRLDFAPLAVTERPRPSPAERSLEILDELQFLLLGYDVDESTTRSLVAERQTLDDAVAADDPAIMEAEDLLLTRFTDLAALSLRQPVASPDGDGTPGLSRPSPQQSLHTYIRALHAQGRGLSEAFLADLKRALAHYDIHDLKRWRGLEETLLLIHRAHVRVTVQLPVIVSILERRLRHVSAILPGIDEAQRELLLRLTAVSRNRYPAVADLARELRYEYFDQPLFDAVRQQVYREAEAHLDGLARARDAAARQPHMEALVESPQPLMTLLSNCFIPADLPTRCLILECLTRRYYRIRDLKNVRIQTLDGLPVVTAQYAHEGKRFCLTTVRCDYENLTRTGQLILPVLSTAPPDHEVLLDIYVHRETPEVSEQDTLDHVRRELDAAQFPHMRRVITSVRVPGTGLGMTGQRFFTFRQTDKGLDEERVLRNVHPMTAKRLDLWRYSEFELERLPSVEDVYLFHGLARDNPKDERLFALAEVRDLTPKTDDDGNVIGLPNLEYMFQEACAGIRVFQAERAPRDRLHWNRVLLYIWPSVPLSRVEVNRLVRKLIPMTAQLGLEKVMIRARLRRAGGRPRDTVMQITKRTGQRPVVDFFEPVDHHVRPLTPYRQKVLKMRSRGLHYPYEIIRILTPDEHQQSTFPRGEFVEYDLDDGGALVPIERPFGQNRANVVVGLISNRTDRYPEGMRRFVILGDPSRGMGSLAEPECTRIIAALDLASELDIPVDWFAVSAGAKIAMDSGTENLDWTARVLRRLIEFTQAGGEVNLVVHGINVGAQSYWNAEATMLMHTRGILIMTPQGAMVLTGKQALDFSGGVSAEDNLGIGGYDRIMGPNGQAQYWAGDMDEACAILMQHYEHCYRAPGERFPRRAKTTDPVDRNISDYPYDAGEDDGFSRVGDIFDDATNPGRKRPFQIRKVMRAVVDQDLEPLERWSAMRDAEIGVVWDAHFGGQPVCLIGIESRPITRAGFVAADGPEQWTAGTLFPGSSRKISRAINAASDNRPVVMLANLSGFDGSPESMRAWQLEYGAEIGRAMVNFAGPIVFCVISRYHGGAFVVFSKTLNENLEVAALDGAFASVIGGAPAAAVVFTRDVLRQTASDPALVALRKELDRAASPERGKLMARYDALFKKLQAEHRGHLAERFDRIHSVARARDVGSIDAIIPSGELRRYLIEAVERGIERLDPGVAASAGAGDVRSTAGPR